MSKLSHIFPVCCSLVVSVSLSQPSLVHAIQTNDVEIGVFGMFDDKVHIGRDAEGNLTFLDSAITSPVSLSELKALTSSHTALTELDADDHVAYLTSGRHLAAHSADANSTMAIPLDVDGNTTLGAHLIDGDIHLDRNSVVDVTGDWRFGGVPQFLSGMSVAGDISLTSDLSVGGVVYGDFARRPTFSEWAHYLMDDAVTSVSCSVEDLTGHFPQTYIGATSDDPKTTDGVVGSALLFDGVDDEVSLGDCAAILGENRDFTLSFWWRSDDFSTGSTRHILSNYLPSASSFHHYHSSDGVVKTSVRLVPDEGSPESLWVSYGTTTIGQWYHYGLVREGTTLRFYRDGALAVSDTDSRNTMSLSPPNVDLTVGNPPGGGTSDPGAMDDLRLYGRALSDGEVASLYNVGSGLANRSSFVMETDGALSIDQLGVDGAVTSGVLQVSDGAYCDGLSWVNVSSRDRKTSITVARPKSEWSALDRVEVVEFAYKRRNPNRGAWLDPNGAVVRVGSPEYRQLTLGDEAVVERLLEQGYRIDSRALLDDPAARRQLGFIAEDLCAVDARLARPDGVAAIDVAAFNTAVLQEVKRRIEALEAR